MNPKILQLFGMLALVLLQNTLSHAESEQEKAKQWLERMVDAARTLNYEGTFVYVRGQHLEAMHIIHRADSQGERQRMFSLNGSLREVVIANNQVTCLTPKKRTSLGSYTYTRSPFPISLPRELEDLEDHYRFKMLGRNRIANRETVVIAIQPRDKLRFGYRLWLDHDTAIVLRSALLDEERHVLEQLMFTQFEVKSEIDDSLLAPLKSVQKLPRKETEDTAEKVEQSVWELSELPPGFSQVMHNRFSISVKQPTEHIVLTDGLATVSIFVEPLNGVQPLLQGASQMGAMNAFGLVMAGHQVMVVGEVPQTTVQMIAAAMQYAEENRDQ